ncbi:branched-chain amino acid ABC transporter permease [Zhengella mangrovi]|uniref:Branched-chain amino acid ABC transporter permease n=1 Tax=Zhengella mangrovi TaxID=1982044 RepID=A0A2G1QQT4_9HYPH|nr:branched-chain amino acid ABC transporter permease [Zhengella mangrovi]PHP67886.1 branched-chain amino acid ABC transporter permease [Zhengella mangrovi]
MTPTAKAFLLHGGLVLALVAGHFILPEYHQGNLARIMALAVYAMGYNVLFGYSGLLSLGHAMFFSAGMYGMGLSVQHLGFGAGPAFVCGILAGVVLATAVGVLALRTTGVAFMIVTLMFSQAVFLTILYFTPWTRGDEGFVIQPVDRMLFGIDLSDATYRYFAALVLFAIVMLATSRLIQAPFGRVLIAIRENEERTRMLGYDVYRHKLGAVILSGTISAVSGAAYGLLFGYVGASFASVQYSILPLLWVLLGGAGTIVGPFLGTLFMFYLIDLTSSITTAYMLLAGAALVLLTLFAPEGLAGSFRRRLAPWLP